MNKFYRYILLFTLFPLPAMAGGIPVIDAAGIAKTVEQIAQGARQLDALQSQIRQMDQQLAALTGSRGMSDMLSGFDMDSLLPTSMQADAGAATAASRRYDDYQTADQPISLNDIAGADTDDGRWRASAYADARNSAYTALASSEAMLEGTSEVNEAYAALISEIDRTSDLKGSVDLLARISAENGRSLARLTQLMAVGTHASAAQYRQDAANQEFVGVRTVTSESFARAAAAAARGQQ